MNNNLIHYNILNYKRLMSNNIQGEIELYLSLQMLCMSIFYIIYCFYIFSLFYFKVPVYKKNNKFISYNINPSNYTSNYFKFKKYNFNILFYNILWNLINTYSYVYINIKKYKIIIFISDSILNIKNKYYINTISNNNIDVIYKGEVILSSNTFNNVNNIKNIFNIELNNIKCDFLIYKNNEIQLNKILKKKIYETNLNIELINKSILTIDKSNIKFFVVCIQIYNNNSFEFDKYDLNLNNFMVVDNELLSKEFILWYLNIYYNKKYNIISDKDLYYKIEIIDHNVNKISIFPENYIIVKKDDYMICNCK